MSAIDGRSERAEEISEMKVSQCILVYEDLIDSGVNLEADTYIPFQYNLSLDRSSANKNLGLYSILQVNGI